jgi:hypothetical protein
MTTSTKPAWKAGSAISSGRAFLVGEPGEGKDVTYTRFHKTDRHGVLIAVSAGDENTHVYLKEDLDGKFNIIPDSHGKKFLDYLDSKESVIDDSAGYTMLCMVSLIRDRADKDSVRADKDGFILPEEIKSKIDQKLPKKIGDNSGRVEGLPADMMTIITTYPVSYGEMKMLVEFSRNVKSGYGYLLVSVPHGKGADEILNVPCSAIFAGSRTGNVSLGISLSLGDPANRGETAASGGLIDSGETGRFSKEEYCAMGCALYTAIGIVNANKKYKWWLALTEEFKKAIGDEFPELMRLAESMAKPKQETDNSQVAPATPDRAILQARR